MSEKILTTAVIFTQGESVRANYGQQGRKLVEWVIRVLLGLQRNALEHKYRYEITTNILIV